MGLWLLHLLTQNKWVTSFLTVFFRISEFHTELELIPESEHKNMYLSVPIDLEHHFADGSYNIVLSMKQNLPLNSYRFFIDQFVNTVREEMARSAERSYTILSLREAMDLFLLDNNE